jgi:hypothetical protein
MLDLSKNWSRIHFRKIFGEFKEQLDLVVSFFRYDLGKFSADRHAKISPQKKNGRTVPSG